MLDNELIQIFRPILISGLTNLGFTSVQVKQSFQPTQQGANNGPTVYFFKLWDQRYGWVGRHDTVLSSTEMAHTETQFYKTAFQVIAWYKQDPSVVSYTAADLLNFSAAILQSDTCISTLAANNAGVLKISEVRNPYFLDDRDQHEASPSFDVIFTHAQVLTSTVQSVDDVTGNTSFV